MKRKSIILLSSILAGSLLVGGAFAIYAVTDSADPIGINVTPGYLDEDSTDYVTLNWGEGTSLSGVGQLEVGQNRKVGTVYLQAVPTYSGVFSVQTKDNTTVPKSNDAAKLFDYLNVYIYPGVVSLDEEGNLPSDPADLPSTQKILAGSAVKYEYEDPEAEEPVVIKTYREAAFVAEGNKDGNPYTIFVNLDETAGAIYNQIANDKVYLEAEWAPKQGDEVTEHVAYYVNSNTHWENVYAYAWAGAKVNAGWPGVKMVNLYDDVYQINIPADMKYIVFNNGLSGESELKTADITLPETIDGTHPAVYQVQNLEAYPYAAVKLDKVPEKAPEVGDTIVVKKNGTIVPFDDIKQDAGDNKAAFKMELAKGDKVTAVDGMYTLNFYSWDEVEKKSYNYESEYEAQFAGTRTFYYNQDGDIYVDSEYFVVGAWGTGTQEQRNHWEDTSVKLVYNTETKEFATSEALALKAGDSIKVMSSEKRYYPGGEETEYHVTEDGNYNVYFKPAGGNEDWHYHLFYVGKVTD